MSLTSVFQVAKRATTFSPITLISIFRELLTDIFHVFLLFALETSQAEIHVCSFF